MIKRSIENFLAAIDSETTFAPAWNGLGVAISSFDPILAQHCFCLSLQLNKSGAGKFGT